MKKILPILLVSMLVLGGLGASALSNVQENSLTKTATLSISKPVFNNIDEYISIDLQESDSLLLDTGKPVLPVIVKTFDFPLGTQIKDVSVDYDSVAYTLSGKIQPSPRPVPLSAKLSSQLPIYAAGDKSVYASSELFPSQPVTVRKGAGMKNGVNAIFVNVRVTPQYAPADDTVHLPEGDLDISIEYIPPKAPYFAGDEEYDLLIITPETFASNLQPLVDHKTDQGLEVMVKTTEEIYDEYTDGRDDAEKIKLCIYDMKETHNITYVFLAGGRKGQSQKWYIPERVTNNDDGWEAGYASDLYYADIYKIEDNETVFEDWDSNGNDVFAEWSNMVGRSDVIDYYPDISIGRIPFRYASDVDIAVDKIITYETTVDSSWFKKGIVISGDTFPPSRGGSPGWNEGEMETGITADLLESIGFTVDKLWLSLDAWDSSRDIINALSEGAGAVHFAGHGNPASWGNFPPDAETEEEYINGLQLKEMRKLRNGDKLPVVVVGGCHNAQFNVTMTNIIHDWITYVKQYIQEEGLIKGLINGTLYYWGLRFYFMEWVPRDWSSWLVLEKGGGSIATMGMTGLGYGYTDSYATAGLGGWIEPRFFDAYANQSIGYLGPAHDQAIVDYINIIGGVNKDNIDRKTIEEWTLIGDPSLKIGGYS